MTPTPSTLKAEARAQLAGLSADLAETAPGTSVHGARRRIKRLRSLLRLVRGAIGETAYHKTNDSLRAAADALAGQRRAEALVAAALKLDDRTKGGLHLLQLAQDHRTASAALGPEDALTAARGAVAAASKNVSSWRIAKQDAATVADAFADTYRKARKRLAAGLDSQEPDMLHDARKQVIHHLHHLELLGKALQKSPEAQIEKLEALREVLGDLNDLDELRQLAGVEGQSPRGHVARTVTRHRKALLARARKAWKPLFRHKPKAYAKRIGAMWPKTQD